MKFKIYSTYKNARINNALIHLRESFSELPGFKFTEISYIEPMEKEKTFYETVFSWAGLKFKESKSVSTSFLMSLPHEGCDAVILFLNKDKALETRSLYGQHSYRVKDSVGRSYIEIYDDEKYVRFDKKGNYRYSLNKAGSSGESTSMTAKHEVYHAIPDHYGFEDKLHVFIDEGNWSSYHKYIYKNVMEKLKSNDNARILHDTAVSCLGIDVTPRDEVNDNVACAASVNAIHKKAFGFEIGGLASTYNMYNALLNNGMFKRVDVPEPGDVVISPTGYAGKGGIHPNGHVGIMGIDGTIMSNDSRTGLWSRNFDLDRWKKRYVIEGKYPMVFFRKITK